jgi:hypothetical protein
MLHVTTAHRRRWNMGKNLKEKKEAQKTLKKSSGYLRKGAKNLAK